MRNIWLIGGSLFLFACIGIADARAASSGAANLLDLSLSCLGQDHRLTPSRSMRAGCLIAQPLPDVKGGQRLRTGTVPIWYTKGVVAGVAYSLDLAWAVRVKGNVYFWLKEEYAPEKLINGRSFTTRISEAMYDCAKGHVVAIKSWDYDTTGAAHVAKAQRTVINDIPANAMNTLTAQCSTRVQAY